jgi:hypothetical protein
LESNRENREYKVAMILKYFGIIMAIFYFIMGAGVLVLPVFESLSTYYRYIFAAMFFTYGAFRLYRILKR